MTTTRFAALAVRPREGISVYGPFRDRGDATLAADWLGATEPDVRATRSVALHPPEQPALPGPTGSVGEVVELPDDVAIGARDDATPATPSDADGLVVALVLPSTPRCALFVGPFDTPATAIAWCASAEAPDGGREAEAHPLPMRHSDIKGDTPPQTASPAVVLVDTDSGPVVYGPFSSGLDAALYWQHITSVLRLTNVRQAHVCDLTPPQPDHDAPRPDTAPATAGERGWVLRLHNAATPDGDPVLVGPFTHERAAAAWHRTGEPTPAGAPSPIHEP